MSKRGKRIFFIKKIFVVKETGKQFAFFGTNLVRIFFMQFFMKKILHLSFLLGCCTPFFAQTTGICNPQTFLLQLGDDKDFQRGMSLCPSVDGNLYVAFGTSSLGLLKGSILAKITTSGEVLWSKGIFIDSERYFSIFKMLLDSEGMIIIAGISLNIYNNRTDRYGVVLRYDPDKDSILWAKRMPGLNTKNGGTGILELTSSGNYLFYRTLTRNDGQETEMIELNRTDGAIINGKARRMGMDKRTEIIDAQIHKGYVYVLGTQSDTIDKQDSGHYFLCKIDEVNGQPLWANTGPDNNSYYAGVDLLIDEDFLVSLFFSDTKLANSRKYIYLQKNTLDGQVTWLRRYELPNFSEVIPLSMIATPGGYLIFCQSEIQASASGDYFIFTTDKQGHIISTCQIPTPASFEKSAKFVRFIRDQAIALDGSVYFVGSWLGYDLKNHMDLLDAILLKSDFLPSADACPFAPLDSPVNETTLEHSYVSINLDTRLVPAVAQTIPFSMVADSLNQQTRCARCDQPCDLGPDLGPDRTFYRADTSVMLHAGSGYAAYLWQDGSASADLLAKPGGTYWVEVLDECGFTQRDTIQLFLIENVCDQKDLGCIRWELLEVQPDPSGDWQFRIKLTNFCTSSLDYVAFQLPAGLTASTSANLYSAPASGRSYAIRNPNYSPFYSIRFKATNSGSAMQSGASDVFEYSLPAQAAPAYINTSVRLADGSVYSALLNTFNCPPTPNGIAKRSDKVTTAPTGVFYPNPCAGLLWFNTKVEQSFQVRILNAQGQVVQNTLLNNESILSVDERLPNGLYYLAFNLEGGRTMTQRFVLER